MATKTDNHNPAAKLALRRHFLRKYHAVGEIRVIDCCQGSAKLWTQLRKEFEIKSYWGVDVKPKAGRLRNCRHDVTVFLTIGQWQMGVDRTILSSLGVSSLKIPPGIAVKLVGIGLSYCVAACYDFGYIPVEVSEVDNSTGSARYLGVRLERQNTCQ